MSTMATTFLGTPLKHAAPAAGNGSRQVTKAAIEYYGPNRPLWLGLKLSKNTVPSYLTGEYPGDYGWDTMRLSADPETFKRYREAEVIHARWAMLGTVGCLFPEILATTRGIDVGEPLWWKAGAQVYSEGGLTYFGFLRITPVAMSGIVAAQVLLMGLAEAYRNNGGPLGMGLDKVYPGGAFDPLGLGDDPDTLAELKVKEIKNGRLAMFSMLGYYAQAICTGKGPAQNWSEHVAAPFDVNGFNISTKFTPQ